MPAGQHLFRRGAIYYWRKRLTTADKRTTILQVSLQTASKERARRLGMELSWVSEELAIDLSSGRLTPDQVRAILRETARNQALCLENGAMLGRTAIVGSATRGVWGETVKGAAWRVLAEQGRAAKAPTDPDEIAALGLDTSEAGLLDRVLDTFRSEKIVPPADATLDYLIKRHASGIEVNMLTLAQTEHAFYRGMAAAYLHTQPRWGCTLDDDLNSAFGDVESAGSTATEAGVTIERTASALRPIDVHPDLVVSPSPSAAIENRPHHPDEPTIGALAERFGAVKIQLGEWSEKTARQAAQTAAFLVRVVGHDRFTRLTQADMGKYVDVLLSVPKTYGKSPRDAECGVAELLERGARLPAGQRGLSGSTINRHLTQLGELIAHAASRGHNPPAAISLTSLRTRKKTRDRDDRDAFTPDDLNSIFRQPVWAGCGGERRRWVAGDCVVHDGLYWAPLIAHYGMMRREEVCGLMIADVVLDTEVPNFDLRPNKYRALKNPQSKRRVPVHPELLRLGLADYIRAVGALGYDLLFPDLLPATEGTSLLGDQLHDDWSKCLKTAVSHAGGGSKTFHSFRHSGNDALTDAEVMLEWRQDILGHGGASEAEERYRSDTRLPRKLEALLKLPVVTADLTAQPIRLRTMVETKIGRRPRLRGPRPQAAEAIRRTASGKKAVPIRRTRSPGDPTRV
jgi:integrase